MVYLVKRREVDGRKIGAGVLRQAHENKRAGDGHDHELLVHPLYVSHVLRYEMVGVIYETGLRSTTRGRTHVHC